MTYDSAIIYLWNNAKNDIHSWHKLVAIQTVGIRTADEIKRVAQRKGACTTYTSTAAY